MISVIVPIYNTSKYLKQCIDSILSQSYRDIELILVNDASKDESLAICLQYQSKDSRIVLVDKKNNEGVDKARFTGISVAKGEYLTFVDSDDWLEPGILKIMLETMFRENVDYVEVGFNRVFDKYKKIVRSTISPVIGLISQPQLFDKYYLSFFGKNILAVNMCGKLYKKSVIDQAHLQPSSLCMGEDLYFNLCLFPHLNSIYILDKIGYNYRFGGMTSKYNVKLYPNLKELYLIKENLIDKYQYTKARDFLRMEIKNVLKSDICQMIVYKIGTNTQIKDIIKDRINDPMWKNALVVNNGIYFNDSFVVALKEKDVDRLYNLCKEEVDKGRYKRFIKKVLNSVLQMLNC